MIARDATGRSKIVMIDGGYHGTSGWMQAPGHHGVSEEDHHHVLRIPWNDVSAFEAVLDRHPGDVAGFIATPYHIPTFADSQMPAEGYWEKIQALCRRHNVVLIVNDIRHGFRLDMAGSSAYFGFTPDLTCLCKALANGYPISALVGCEALKSTAARVFHTGSYWFQAVPMAAARANLVKMGEINAPQVMLTRGALLFDAMVNIAKTHGYDLKVTGVPSMPYARITNDESLMLHQDWCAECTRRGAYFTPHHNWFISAAHNDADIQRTLDIVDEAFKAVRAKYGDTF
jgi:glutamate-1-semialdehyde 2,1-aminomutase